MGVFDEAWKRLRREAARRAARATRARVEAVGRDLAARAEAGLGRLTDAPDGDDTEAEPLDPEAARRARWADRDATQRETLEELARLKAELAEELERTHQREAARSRDQVDPDG